MLFVVLVRSIPSAGKQFNKLTLSQDGAEPSVAPRTTLACRPASPRASLSPFDGSFRAPTATRGLVSRPPKTARDIRATRRAHGTTITKRAEKRPLSHSGDARTDPLRRKPRATYGGRTRESRDPRDAIVRGRPAASFRPSWGRLPADTRFPCDRRRAYHGRSRVSDARDRRCIEVITRRVRPDRRATTRAELARAGSRGSRDYWPDWLAVGLTKNRARHDAIDSAADTTPRRKQRLPRVIFDVITVISSARSSLLIALTNPLGDWQATGSDTRAPISCRGRYTIETRNTIGNKATR